MQPEIVWPAWIIAAATTILFYWLMIRAGRRLRLLMDTPTSKAMGVFVGAVELAGKAVLSAPCHSFLAGAKCVWYRYSIEEEWERWETETYKDKDGKTQTRRVRKSGWTTINKGGEAPPFYIEDDTGSVQVQPSGADIEAISVFSKVVSRGEPLYHQKTQEAEIADSTGRRRFSEQAIPLGQTLFVTGRARERADCVAPEIARDGTEEMFFITCHGEGRLQRGYRWQFWIFGLFMLAGFPVAASVQSQAAAGRVDPVWPIVAGVAAAVLWIVGWVWMAFNSLVGLRNRTAQAWSLVDVQLKRRSDLIPRLVEVVAGLRDHERTVQTEIAALRNQSVATPAGQPGPDIYSAGPTVIAISERYPELKSSDAFLRLQRELSDTETRVALARDYYNSIATHLNTRLEIIPDRWFAPLAGLRPASLLSAAGFERDPVQVKV